MLAFYNKKQQIFYLKIKKEMINYVKWDFIFLQTQITKYNIIWRKKKFKIIIFNIFQIYFLNKKNNNLKKEVEKENK